MIFMLIGIATDEKGNELKDENGGIIQSAYCVSNDAEVAREALDVFRLHQTEDRSTYAPGRICTVKDPAHQAEVLYRAEKMKASVSSSVGEVSDLLNEMEVGGR